MYKSKFFYAPENANAGTHTEHQPQKTTGLPKKDADFVVVAKTVAASWIANPAITLAYTTAPDFNDLVASCETNLSNRMVTGSTRPVITQTLAQLDGTIDEAVEKVKVYIQKKYKENAQAHYVVLGIGKTNERYQLPRDRNKRLGALKLMKTAIVTEGFGTEEYGTDFWSDIYTAYNTGLKDASTSDGKVSEQVASKNDDKEQIKKVMISLRHVLQGNYPDTYKTMYRTWGWQKEDY